MESRSLGVILILKVMRRLSKKLRIIVLFHFGLITFSFHFRSNFQDFPGSLVGTQFFQQLINSQINLTHAETQVR